MIIIITKLLLFYILNAAKYHWYLAIYWVDIKWLSTSIQCDNYIQNILCVNFSGLIGDPNIQLFSIQINGYWYFPNSSLCYISKIIYVDAVAFNKNVIGN